MLMSKQKEMNITDFPENERLKTLKAQYRHEEKISSDNLKEMEKRYDVIFWISVGLIAVLIFSLFSNNTEVPKVAGSVLISLLSYLAGRASR